MAFNGKSGKCIDYHCWVTCHNRTSISPLDPLLQADDILGLLNVWIPVWTWKAVISLQYGIHCKPLLTVSQFMFHSGELMNINITNGVASNKDLQISPFFLVQTFLAQFLNIHVPPPWFSFSSAIQQHRTDETGKLKPNGRKNFPRRTAKGCFANHFKGIQFKYWQVHPLIKGEVFNMAHDYHDQKQERMASSAWDGSVPEEFSPHSDSDNGTAGVYHRIDLYFYLQWNAERGILHPLEAVLFRLLWRWPLRVNLSPVLYVVT